MIIDFIIDFEKETDEIIAKLKYVEGYLDCEKVILYNLKKHVEQGFSDTLILDYMKKLFLYFEELIKSTKDIADCINYRYSAGFLNTLISTPYWRSWIKTINL